METSQKNNYKNEHIASKKALSATGIVTLIVAAVSFYAGSLFGENSVLNMSLFILGIALGIFGFIKIFMGEKVFYHKEPGDLSVSHSAKMREIVWKRFSKKKISNKSVR